MSRPEKPIDWELVDNLLMAGCQGTEIAPHFDMHHKTFYSRVEDKYGMTFTAYCSKKRAQGDACIRAQQYMKALGQTTLGDNTLLIWLGKNRLDQRENPVEIGVSGETISQFNTLMKQLEKLQSERSEVNIDCKTESIDR